MILVLNCGSSSLKYLAGDTRGVVERIGEPDGPADHHAALDQALGVLGTQLRAVRAVGHRVVHGGARFTRPTPIDDAVLDELRRLSPLAPLHNPPAIEGIEAARRLLPGVPQVAVFDTAFHATLPPAAATYAIDADLARQHGIRRYGFHGISCAFVVGRTAALLDRPVTDLNLIVLHLGNGASATAVHGGHSVETSMGFTPLEGLVMGARAGDLDPGIVTHLLRSGVDVDDLLTHHSGLLGLAGAGDLRTVLSLGTPQAELAIDVYCHRIRKYVGAYHAVLGRLDAIVFTAGVGEHAPSIRARCLAGLEPWGIVVDPARNEATSNQAAHNVARTISEPGVRVAVCVVPTDEEAAIAQEVAALV